MKALHFDLSSGCSGDMFVAALLDLGVPFETVRDAAAAVIPEGAFVASRIVSRSGLRAVKFDALPAEAGHPNGGGDESKSPGEQDRPFSSHHRNHHPHRKHADIRRLIEQSPLAPPVKALALDIFRVMAEAEGQVHGVDPADVAFHEIGAVDSILDVVGAAAAVCWLAPDRCSCTPANVGSGTVATAHGLLPVPAPATAVLLRGFPVFAGPQRQETLTPTGAAILKTLVTDPGRPLSGRLLATGCGAGRRETPGNPNIFRAMLLESEELMRGQGGGEIDVLECNLDDMNPELLGDLAVRLPEAGALDVFLVSVQMKKFRPGTLLTVLCRPADSPRLRDMLLRETSTFGVRAHRCQRWELERETVEVETAAGPVEVKLGRWQGRTVKASPEYESCRRAAARAGLPLGQVYRQASEASAGLLGASGDESGEPA